MKKELMENMRLFSEGKWSAKVVTKWEPPEGFFKKSADDIANGLKSASDSLAQAMERLNFYINRAGENLSTEDKSRLEDAKKKLSALYGKEEGAEEEGEEQQVDEEKKVTWAQLSKSAKMIVNESKWDKELEKLGVDSSKWDKGWAHQYVAPIMAVIAEGHGVSVDSSSRHQARTMFVDLLKLLKGGAANSDSDVDEVPS